MNRSGCPNPSRARTLRSVRALRQASRSTALPPPGKRRCSALIAAPTTWWAARVSSLANLTLSGIMITGNLQLAMLKQADGRPLTVRLGQTLPNGWRLEHLTPQYARFALDGRTQTLNLYAKRLPPPSTRSQITLPREPLP